MSRPTIVKGNFDPELCPLLRGLTPDEQLRRMSDDPIIRACVEQLDCPGEQFKHCEAVKAYQKQRDKSASADEACCREDNNDESKLGA